MKYIYNLSEVEGMPSERVGTKALQLAVLRNRDDQLIPEAYVIDSEVSEYYYETAGEYPKGLDKEISKAINGIEKRSKTYLNDDKAPLLLALRISENNKSDGVKNAILNIGLNDIVVEGLIELYGRQRFAYWTYCEFVYDYSIRVLGVQKRSLDAQKEAILNSEKLADYKFLNEKHLKELVVLYKSVVFKETGQRFPEDPIDQLKYAIDAMYDSWESKIARTYRKYKNIQDKGTSVIIQRMVFGNLGVGSGVGNIESRSSKTGEKGIFGEFMHEAQGPQLDQSMGEILEINILEERFADAYKRLSEICTGLEIVNKNPVELDFVIEDGQLWITQIDRPALSAKSSVSVAADMLRNEIISLEEAICGLEGERMDEVFYPEIDERSRREIAFKSKHGSVGVVQGELFFDPTRITEKDKNNRLLIIRSSEEIHPEAVLDNFDGFICLRGSINGRLAKYARINGKPCLINCPDVIVNWNGREISTSNGLKLKERSVVTIDADSCEVLVGEVFLLNPDIGTNLKYMISNADQTSRMETALIAENIDTVQAGKLVNLSNVGEFRLDSFFFEPENRDLVLDAVLKIGISKYGDVTAELTKNLKNYVLNVLSATGDNYINFALFHEGIGSLIPEYNEVIDIANQLNVDENDLLGYLRQFKDENPEFGIKGARLYLKYAILYEIQVRAIIEAVIDSRKASFANGGMVGVLINGFTRSEEAKKLRTKFDSILNEYSDKLDVKIGFKAEVDNFSFTLKTASMAEYFDELCFNLDRITSSLYGLSEEDNIGEFSRTYEYNPFDRLDFETMGDGIINAIRNYKEVSKSKVSVKGRFAINASSVDFFEEAGFDTIYITKTNSLRTKVLAAQAYLDRLLN